MKGVYPAGELYAKRTIADKKIPVFSCEGPCIRGEIARLAANLMAHELSSLARACHAETFLVPHSPMARWVKDAEKTVMIDGCFLKCHGRVPKKLICEEERKVVARQVAVRIIASAKPKRAADAFPVRWVKSR